MSYIIAEIGGNHDGSLERARELLTLAAASGVNAVKFQIYDPDKLVHPDTPSLPQAKGYRKQIDRFRDLSLTKEDFEILYEDAGAMGVDFLATCFDIETLKCWAPRMKYIKISSGDITYEPLLRVAANTMKPVILSTGMSSPWEIKEAARIIHPNYLTVLHCVSLYPCPIERANLGYIQVLKNKYRKVGYSDHTIGINACRVALSLGCEVIEKHFTDDPSREDGDHPCSATATQMSELVSFRDNLKLMMGNFKPSEGEREQKKAFRRGIYASKDLFEGNCLKEEDVIYLRPEAGHTKVGMTLTRNYKRLEAIG